MTLRQFEIQNICDFQSSSLRFETETQISSFQPVSPLSLGAGDPQPQFPTPSPSSHPQPAVRSLSQAVCVSIICLAHFSLPTILTAPVSGSFGAYLVKINPLADTQTPQCPSPASCFLSQLSKAWRLPSAIGDLCFPSARPIYGVTLPPPSPSLSCF